jgi:hypothetical protein
MSTTRTWLVWMALSFATALISSITIFRPDFWFDLFQPRMGLVDLTDYIWMPLWLIATSMAFFRFPGQRKRIWWLLVPMPVALLPFFQVIFVVFAWGTRGFAP